MSQQWTVRRLRLWILALALLLALLHGPGPAQAYDHDGGGGSRGWYRCAGLSAAGGGGPQTDGQCGW